MIGPAKVRLLDIDPDLGAALTTEAFKAARHDLVVGIQCIAGPDWRPDCRPREAGHLGFLMTSGMMVREMRIGRGRGIELLTAGDLLRPSQEDSASFVTARWRILERIELAELDQRLATALGRFPPLVDALLGRVMERSRSQAAYAAIESVRGLDEKLLTLFWHLAERHGTRTEQGVSIPLPLTHQILADLVGARRPSVSLTLKRLSDDGLVIRTGDGWLLGRDLPVHLLPAGDTV